MKKTLFFITVFICFLIPVSTFAKSDASLKITTDLTELSMGDEFDVHVDLDNPSAQSIVSVRSWLSYNPDFLEAVSIDTKDSPFTLSAPGEFEIDRDQGLIKLGRSNVSGGYKQIESKIATVHFKVKTAYAVDALIEVYDYQNSELGHTSVNIIDQAFPMNILSEEPKALTLHLNIGGPSMNDQNANLNLNVNAESGSSSFDLTVNQLYNLQRPSHLQVNTGDSYVDLKWDLDTDPSLVGYNIYYGKSSGVYTRRRTIGKVNHYRLDSLNNGEAYYFAITAYDLNSMESDYSDEVAIIINEILSSTSPFDVILASMLSKVPMEPQNGPLVGWLAFSAFGLGGILVFRRKKHIL